MLLAENKNHDDLGQLQKALDSPTGKKRKQPKHCDNEMDIRSNGGSKRKL